MIDKAALEAVYEAGRRSGEPIIENYADAMVAIADIKIARPLPEDEGRAGTLCASAHAQNAEEASMQSS